MRYVPTHLPTDPTIGVRCRDYTDPAEGNTGTCQACGSPHMELDSDGLCEVCTERRAEDHAEWIRDRAGESSDPAVYVDSIPFQAAM